MRPTGIAILLMVGATSAPAQWVKLLTPGAPRTRDGKVNLSAPAPRAKNGKPDLSGMWQADGAPFEELLKFTIGGVNGLGEDDPSRYFFNALADFKPGEEPMRPEVAAAWKKQLQSASKERPATLCNVPSMPIAETTPAPHKIVQTPDLLLVLYEDETTFRQIHLDGRTLSGESQPSFLGYSVGRWEGDTLIVEVSGFNDRGPLDIMGHPHSAEMRITERLRRRDYGHLEVEMAINDPKFYSQPFSFKFLEHLVPDTDLIEAFCAENETDAKHMPVK
jgi:hypothetical protein